MKCLVVTNTDRMVSLFFIPHIKLLRRMGYEVEIATSIRNPQSIKEEFPDITLHHVPFTRNLNPIKNIRAYTSINKLLGEGAYDFVHVHTPIAAFLVRMAAPSNQQIIYTAHGFHFHKYGSALSNWVYYSAEKLAASKTTKLIVINEEDYQKALSLLPREKIHYIHGVGLDAERFNPRSYSDNEKRMIREEFGISRDKIVITHLAEFNENKRQIDIVLAADELRKKNKNFVFLLLGEGPLELKIKAEIKSRQLEDYVFCLGYREDIDNILSITDIGLLVSLREGLPKSVMEMMAMEIPLIVTDIRGNRDLVIDGENGCVIPIKEPKLLMEACSAFIQNDISRIGMGKKGRERILEKFELRIILGELESIYGSFITNNANPIGNKGEQSAHIVTIMD